MPTEIHDWNDLNNIRNNLTDDYVLKADLDSTTAGYDQHVTNNTVTEYQNVGRFYGVTDGDVRTPSAQPVTNISNVSTESPEIEASITNGGDDISFTRTSGTPPDGGAIVTVTYTVSLDSEEVTGWEPIGDIASANIFQGTFDGNGHTISGLTYKYKVYGGLFLYLQNSTVKNLNIECTASESLVMSSLAGFQFGATVKNVSTDFTCNYNATFVKRDANVGMGLSAPIIGGIIGRTQSTTNASSTITKCDATVDVSVSTPNTDRNRDSVLAGGIAGASTNCSQCHASGSIDISAPQVQTVYAGGISCICNGTSTNCKLSVDITISSSGTNEYAGGLHAQVTNADDQNEVSKCLVTADTISVSGSATNLSQSGAIAANAETDVVSSYWDNSKLSSISGVGSTLGSPSVSTTGAPTADLTGETAPTTLSEFSFGDIWRTFDGEYAGLLTHNPYATLGAPGERIDSKSIVTGSLRTEELVGQNGAVIDYNTDIANTPNLSSGIEINNFSLARSHLVAGGNVEVEYDITNTSNEAESINVPVIISQPPFPAFTGGSPPAFDGSSLYNEANVFIEEHIVSERLQPGETVSRTRVTDIPLNRTDRNGYDGIVVSIVTKDNVYQKTKQLSRPYTTSISDQTITTGRQDEITVTVESNVAPDEAYTQNIDGELSGGSSYITQKTIEFSPSETTKEVTIPFNIPESETADLTASVETTAEEFAGYDPATATITPQKPAYTLLVDTAQGGSTSNTRFKLTTGSGTFNYDVNWSAENGTASGSQTGVTGDEELDFGSEGKYELRITGQFPHQNFSANGDAPKVVEVRSWGDISWQSMESMFEGCTNLAVTADDAPDLSNVTNMSKMFKMPVMPNEVSLGDLNSWDTSSVQNMSETFLAVRGGWSVADPSSINISDWDTSSVTNASSMFKETRATISNLESWNMSSVTDMSKMFYLDVNSTSMDNVPDGIYNWDTSSVTNMGDMFTNSEFNQDISSWDTSSVTNMDGMFNNSTFDQDISNWNVSQISSKPTDFDNSAGFAGQAQKQPQWGEPTGMAVVNVSSNSPVSQGDRLIVDVTLHNISQSTKTQTVSLEADNSVGLVDNISVSVPAKTQHTVSLIWDTTNDAVQTYTATVSTDDDSNTTSVEIQ